MRLTVHKQLSDDLRILSGMDGHQFEKLCEQFSNLPVRMFPYDDIDLAVRASGFQDEEASSVSEFVLNVFFLLFAYGKKPSSMAESLADKVVQADFSETERGNLRTRLERLFSIEPLFISIKATNLFNDNERVLVGSKILTDVRPVFPNGDTDAVLGYTVIHNLKLIYQDSEGSKEFLVALGIEELQSLEEDLSRARGKMQAISRDGLLKQAKIVGEK